MIDASETLTAAMEDFGLDALVGTGPETLRCLPPEVATAAYSGETITRTGLLTLAMADAVAALDLSAGNEGDTLTINGTDYTLLAIDPDGMGGAVLRLEAHP